MAEWNTIIALASKTEQDTVVGNRKLVHRIGHHFKHLLRGGREGVKVTFILFLLVGGLKQSYKSIRVVHSPKYKGPFRMDCRKRGSHDQSVYPTQDTSLTHGNSKGKARGRSKHKSNSKRVVRNPEEKNVGTKIKNPKQGLTSAEDVKQNK